MSDSILVDGCILNSSDGFVTTGRRTINLRAGTTMAMTAVSGSDDVLMSSALNLVAGSNITVTQAGNNVTIASPLNGFCVGGSAVVPITAAGVRTQFNGFYFNEGDFLWSDSLYETTPVDVGNIIRVDLCFNITTPSPAYIRVILWGVTNSTHYFPDLTIPAGFTGLYYNSFVVRIWDISQPLTCMLEDPSNTAVFDADQSWLFMSKLK